MALDLTGKKFGRLTGVKCVGTDNKNRMWEFLCDCGETIVRRAAAVNFGSVTSCGCWQRESTSKNHLVDKSGKRFGRLTVVKISHRNNHKAVVWECLCDCGNTAFISSGSLKENGTKSCGCLQKESVAARQRANKQENPISKTKEYRSALRKRLRECPVHAMQERTSRMMSHALASVNAVKSGRTFDMLGYTPAELKEHLEKQFTGGMSWDNRSDWQVDHIVPISLAKTEDDVIALNQLSNLRPLWNKENNKKNAKRIYLV